LVNLGRAEARRFAGTEVLIAAKALTSEFKRDLNAHLASLGPALPIDTLDAVSSFIDH
jgi:hypothetical protein